MINTGLEEKWSEEVPAMARKSVLLGLGAALILAVLGFQLRGSTVTQLKSNLAPGHYGLIDWTVQDEIAFVFRARSEIPSGAYVWSLESGSKPVRVPGERIDHIVRMSKDRSLWIARSTEALRRNELFVVERNGVEHSLGTIDGSIREICLYQDNGDVAIVRVQVYPDGIWSEGHPAMFVVDRRSKKWQEVELHGESIHACAWSPDSELLAVQIGRIIGVLDLGTGRIDVLREVGGHEHIVVGPDLSWSPNSQWLAFVVGSYIDESAVYALNVNAPDALEELYRGPIARIQWSPNGKHLLATTIGTPGENELVLIEVPKKYWE